MSLVLLRNMVLSMAIAMMPAAAWADARGKVDMLLRDYGSISRDLRQTQLTQSALLRQKETLDAQGSALSRHQDTLNARPSDPAAGQQQAPDEDKSRCNNQGHVDGKDTPPRADECAHKTKKLKKMSLTVSAGVLFPETQQTQLDLEFSRYDEAANDWNAQEQQTIIALNGLYRALNSWADRAEGLISSGPFQAEIIAEHWGKYCPNSVMPSGVLSIDEVVGFADRYAKCLKYVAAQRKPDASG